MPENNKGQSASPSLKPSQAKPAQAPVSSSQTQKKENDAKSSALTEEQQTGVSSTEQEETEEPESIEKAPSVAALTPGGVIMLLIAGFFDVLGWICVILYVVFGVGALVGRIVSWTGLGIITIWQLARGKAGVAVEKIKEEAKGKLWQAAKSFASKNATKLVAEAAPVVGDIIPTCTWIVWSELGSE